MIPDSLEGVTDQSATQISVLNFELKCRWCGVVVCGTVYRPVKSKSASPMLPPSKLSYLIRNVTCQQQCSRQHPMAEVACYRPREDTGACPPLTMYVLSR